MSRSELRSSRPFLYKALTELPTLPYGVEADWNQMQLLQHAASRAGQDPAWLTMASGLAAWAWQQRPLEKALLASLVQLQKQAPVMPRQGGALLEICNRHLQQPQGETAAADSRQLALQVAQQGKLPQELAGLLALPGAGLHWLGRLFPLLLDEGLFAPCMEMLERTPALKALTPLEGRLRAEWAMAALPPVEALAELDQVDETLFPHWKAAMRASLLLRQDAAAGRGEAATIYRELWRQLPWHVNACLAAWELRQPLGMAPEEALGEVCVVLYTWNKAEDLRRTLDSLAVSELGAARVICLDNGSTDATSEVLLRAQRQWQERGHSELELVRLPVNIGAPAARQWLLQLPQVREAGFVAYLDDDIFLPANWLRQLLARALDAPRASAVGCRIERHKAPHLLQAADFNLLPPSLCGSGFTDLQENVFPCNNGLGRRDSGLLCYSRPCVSLTGCCHLLRRESLERVGGFDIRFSPSQFDDLERDLRAFAAGWENIYHGALVVRHVQHSSLGQAADSARQSHIHGNKVKLEHLFDRQAVERMAVRNRRQLENDFAAKAVALGE